MKGIFTSGAIFSEHVVCYLLIKNSTKKEIKVLVRLSKAKGKTIQM